MKKIKTNYLFIFLIVLLVIWIFILDSLPNFVRLIWIPLTIVIIVLLIIKQFKRDE